MKAVSRERKEEIVKIRLNYLGELKRTLVLSQLWSSAWDRTSFTTGLGFLEVYSVGLVQHWTFPTNKKKSYTYFWVVDVCIVCMCVCVYLILLIYNWWYWIWGISKLLLTSRVNLGKFFILFQFLFYHLGNGTLRRLSLHWRHLCNSIWYGDIFCSVYKS